MMKTPSIKKTSYDWYNSPEFANLKMINADGWDRENIQYAWFEELITKDEFLKRLSESTIYWYFI